MSSFILSVVKKRTRGAYLPHKFPRSELGSKHCPGMKIGGVNGLGWRKLTLTLTSTVDAGLEYALGLCFSAFCHFRLLRTLPQKCQPVEDVENTASL